MSASTSWWSTARRYEGHRVSATCRSIGFMACDAEHCQEVGGVAGVAARRSGDGVAAVETHDADGEVARLAMARGALPVRTWQASSAKVVSRRWCNASMLQYPRTRSGLRAWSPMDGPSTGMSSDTAMLPPIQGISPRWDRKGAAHRPCSGSERKHPQDLIPDGTHPIGMAPPKRKATVFAGRRATCGPGWT